MSKEFKIQKKKFLLDGYLHVKNFFNEKKLNKVLTTLKNKNKKFFQEETRLVNAHRKMDNLLPLFKNKKIKQYVTLFLGNNNIYGLQSEFFVNPPKKTKGHPPHQDDFFLKTGVNKSINVWIPFVKTYKKNGALMFYLDSHKKSINNKINELSLNKSKNLKFFNKFKKKTINCNIGDVIFIGNSIFHKSHDNLSNANRYVAAFGYIVKGAPFVKGRTAKRRLLKLN